RDSGAGRPGGSFGAVSALSEFPGPVVPVRGDRLAALSLGASLPVHAGGPGHEAVEGPGGAGLLRRCHCRYGHRSLAAAADRLVRISTSKTISLHLAVGLLSSLPSSQHPRISAKGVLPCRCTSGKHCPATATKSHTSIC